MIRNRTPELVAAARIAVAHAFQIGLLRRPNFCAQCGAPSARLIGHHRDYAFPLVLEWLCHRCHGEEHAGDERAPIRARQRCAGCLRLIYLHTVDAGGAELVDGLGWTHKQCFASSEARTRIPPAKSRGNDMVVVARNS